MLSSNGSKNLTIFTLNSAGYFFYNICANAAENIFFLVDHKFYIWTSGKAHLIRCAVYYISCLLKYGQCKCCGCVCSRQMCIWWWILEVRKVWPVLFCCQLWRNRSVQILFIWCALAYLICNDDAGKLNAFKIYLKRCVKFNGTFAYFFVCIFTCCREKKCVILRSHLMMRK